jgi:hypothetical protein
MLIDTGTTFTVLLLTNNVPHKHFVVKQKIAVSLGWPEAVYLLCGRSLHLTPLNFEK